MKTQDAVYYGGLIAGMILGAWLLRELGVTGLFQLLGGLALGAGYTAEQVYSNSREKESPTKL
jgi:hypothetical protein